MRLRFLALCSLILVVGCQQPGMRNEKNGKGRTATQDLVETAQQAGNFNILLKAVEAAGLEETLADQGPYTLFAPTDHAFAKLPVGRLDQLLEPSDREQLKNILLYHLVDGKLSSADLKKVSTVRTLEGEELSLHVKDDRIYVNEAVVEGADINATNGIIHVIDMVLIPTQPQGNSKSLIGD